MGRSPPADRIRSNGTRSKAVVRGGYADTDVSVHRFHDLAALFTRRAGNDKPDSGRLQANGVGGAHRRYRGIDQRGDDRAYTSLRPVLDYEQLAATDAHGSGGAIRQAACQ